jgi:hypothetical protein
MCVSVFMHAVSKQYQDVSSVEAQSERDGDGSTPIVAANFTGEDDKAMWIPCPPPPPLDSEFSIWIEKWNTFFRKNVVPVLLRGRYCRRHNSGACMRLHICVLDGPDPFRDGGRYYCVQKHDLWEFAKDIARFVCVTREVEVQREMAMHPELHYQASVGLPMRQNNSGHPALPIQNLNSQNERDYFRTTFRQHFPSFWSVNPQEKQLAGEDHLDDIPFNAVDQ